jgi:hypothetical protein
MAEEKEEDVWQRRPEEGQGSLESRRLRVEVEKRRVS